MSGKTDEELRRLRTLGINELNIGVESGLDEALTYMNKGYTAELHPSNIVRMHGNLPEDKEAMLELVRKTRDQLAGRLNERPVRYGEGAVL